MKPQINKLMTGLAGEYFVAGMMNLKGWIASLTLKNYPGVDIFGMNPDMSNKTVNIQVKSCVGDSFFIGVKRSERPIMKKKIQGPYVFVHFENSEHGKEAITYYILSKSEFITLVNKSDDAYFDGPHPRGPIKEDYPIALSLKKDLRPYQDKWDSLWKE